MPSSTVTLGGITFQGHEVPEKIPFGGKQRLAKRVLIGGKRVVDAMGPEEGDRRWEGRFRGDSALSRAKAVDAMRRAGAQIPLTWGGLYYLVVIEDFEADYHRVFDIPYRITCYVVDDGSGAGDLGTSLDDLVGGDLSAAIGLVGSALTDPVGTALGALSSAVGSVPSLLTAPLSAVAPIQSVAAQAVGAVSAAIDTTDEAITAAGEPDPALLAGPGFANALTGQLDALQQQDALLQARGLVGRIAINLNTIPG